MILSIDLGTTNSLGSVWSDGGVKLIPNALGEFLTPSCVSVDEDGTILVGKSARERLQTHPDKSISLFKRYMGTGKTTRLGSKAYRSEELSALVLRAIKEDAEEFLGHSIHEAIITVPAYFSDVQRKTTKIAGQLAGLKVERMLSEPTAAALSYGLHNAPDESCFLIFDLGGGTFDVSVIEKFEGVMEVRATAGDNLLGGEDFTQAIIEYFYRENDIPAEANGDAVFQQQLMARAELLKQSLSVQNSDSLSVHWGSKQYTISLHVDQFYTLTQHLVQRLRDPVERALRDARLRAGDIDNIVLAGGATRMPLVRQLVTRMFGRFPLTELNPDEVVANGAAVMAGLKMKDKDLSEIVMTDVCPYTLSTEVTTYLPDGSLIDGISSPIIERNTVVPVSRVETYYAGRDNQEYMLIGVYQGEGRYVKDCISLGELKVALPGLLRSQSAIDVRFTYDVNGLLEVETRLHHTGEIQHLVIKSALGDLSEDEIASQLQSLSELKIHPRDKMENRTLLARAERCFQQLRGTERDRVGAEILQFESVLLKQNERESRTSRLRLRAFLDAIDKDNYFASDFEL